MGYAWIENTEKSNFTKAFFFKEVNEVKMFHCCCHKQSNFVLIEI